MPRFNTLDDADVAGKTVLVRCDLNVPMKDGKVTDATRLKRSARTLAELAANGAKVVVLSHFGRPEGKAVSGMSLSPVAAALSEQLGAPVAFAADCIGDAARTAISEMREGQHLVLENLRYHAGEERNDADFAKQLAALGDLYVNDAFSAAHRAHASTEGVTHHLPALAGRLMQAELEALGAALEAPEKPVAALVGGAKVSTKMEVLGNLAGKVDLLIIGGGMANTFLAAQGANVGKSLCEHDMLDAARDILSRAKAAGCGVALPTDAVVAREFAEGAANEIVPVNEIPAGGMMLDLGPNSVAALKSKLKGCKTVVWNGPMGAFEIKPFDAGTNGVAQKVAALTAAGTLLSVAGGGDTAAALANAGVEKDFSYVSAAGGAFLEWLEGKTLPGVAALES